jgi:hypothetical protein
MEVEVEREVPQPWLVLAHVGSGPGQQPSTKFDKERAQQRYREARAFGPASVAGANLCSEPLLLLRDDPKRLLQA